MKIHEKVRKIFSLAFSHLIRILVSISVRPTKRPIKIKNIRKITGGATRTVKNNSLKYANIREGAGLKSKVITKLNNGTKVRTTGNKIKKDGYVWYEITLENGSDNAWIAGSLIGY